MKAIMIWIESLELNTRRSMETEPIVGGILIPDGRVFSDLSVMYRYIEMIRRRFKGDYLYAYNIH